MWRKREKRTDAEKELEGAAKELEKTLRKLDALVDEITALAESGWDQLAAVEKELEGFRRARRLEGSPGVRSRSVGAPIAKRDRRILRAQ